MEFYYHVQVYFLVQEDMKYISVMYHSNDTSLLKSLLLETVLKIFFSHEIIFLEFICFLFKINNWSYLQ